MTYQATVPVRVRTMGPALFGLHGAGCGCGCSGMGVGPISQYLFSETESAKALAKDYDTAVLVTGVAAGAAAGVVGALVNNAVVGLGLGALVGFLVYQTQRPSTF